MDKPVQVVMTQGKFEILSEIDDAHEQAEVARALGLAREDLDEELPIQVITTGLSCLAVPVRSLATCAIAASMRRCSPKFTRVTAQPDVTRSRARHSRSARHAHTRDSLLLPTTFPKIPRLAAHAERFGAYLVHHGALTLEPEDGRYKFVIEQGDFIHRPSRINLDVKGEAGASKK